VPFSADSAVEIMAAHISTQPPPLHERAPWIPPMFERLVMRMLAKDPQARPPIREVEEQLAQMRAQPEIANAAPVAGGVAAQWTPTPSLAAATPVTQIGAARKRRGVVIGIVAAVAIAGGVVAVLAFGGGSAKPKQEVAAIAPAPAPAPMKVASAEPEPAKPEPAKTEPVNVAEPVKVDATQVEPEPAKPEPAKHVAAKPGTLAITIAGAQKGNVVVDGKRVGSNVATISVELAPGEHRVRVEAPGHRPVQHVVRVEAGANQPLSIPLGAKSIDTIHDPFAE
jgi:hypothetical protein